MKNSESKIERGVDDREQPKAFIQSISFNDGTVLDLAPNSIIVFVGANNSGKSQVLRDVERSFQDSVAKTSIVISRLSYQLIGAINEAFLREHFRSNEHGYLEPFGVGGSYDKASIEYDWDRGKMPDVLRSFLIKRISTEMRLKVSNAIQRSDYSSLSHPIYKISNSESLASQVSSYFMQAFGEELIVNRNDFQAVSLHVGPVPNKQSYTIDRQDEYYAIVAALPKLQNQGDGMRSFASILLDTFTSEYSITLIDEPEAFLHPPQARILGKMLASNNPEERQLLISTHSEDFLQGLLDADNEHVTIVRINRAGSINNMSVLSNDRIEELWTNPLLRYSNILSGLFHEKVVVCESDYDCLFYQAIMDAVYENKGEIAPDILFTHCGGKTRAKDVVRALKAVDVPVVAICDFDLLNSSHVFKPLIEAFDMNWEALLASGMRTFFDSVNARKSKDINVWERLKRTGKAGLDGQEPAAYERVETICKETGLYIVPCGEMECFDRTVNREKKEWVYYILENYDLATETKLNEARSFVQSIVDF